MGGLSKERRLTLAICLSSTFLVIEVIGGIWSNSLAILTDASHLLTDIAGFAIALLATIVAKRAADERYTYGLVRAEVIGALLSVLTLWIITGVLLYEAYYRALDWFQGSPSVVNGKLMSMVAIFGIFVNICLAVVFHEDHGGAFHSHDHGHHGDDHGHDHGHSSGGGREEKKAKGGYGSLDCAERGHAHDSGHGHDR
jgi:zinc transporter 2